MMSEFNISRYTSRVVFIACWIEECPCTFNIAALAGSVHSFVNKYKRNLCLIELELNFTHSRLQSGQHVLVFIFLNTFFVKIEGKQAGFKVTLEHAVYLRFTFLFRLNSDF